MLVWALCCVRRPLSIIFFLLSDLLESLQRAPMTPAKHSTYRRSGTKGRTEPLLLFSQRLFQDISSMKWRPRSDQFVDNLLCIDWTASRQGRHQLSRGGAEDEGVTLDQALALRLIRSSTVMAAKKPGRLGALRFSCHLALHSLVQDQRSGGGRAWPSAFTVASLASVTLRFRQVDHLLHPGLGKEMHMEAAAQWPEHRTSGNSCMVLYLFMARAPSSICPLPQGSSSVGLQSLAAFRRCAG